MLSGRVKNKIRINYGYFFIVLTILLQLCTNVLFKSAALSLESFTFLNVLTNVLYLISIAFYFLRSIVWQLVLKYFDLNYAFLLRSISFALLLAVSHYYFKESIDTYNIIGAVLIIMGVIITGYSYEENE